MKVIIVEDFEKNLGKHLSKNLIELILCVDKTFQILNM